jgi:hemolysin D
MRAQASEQIAKLGSITRQIKQKLAEAESIAATIAKIDASLPLVEQGATIRRKAMEIQYGNQIACSTLRPGWSNSRTSVSSSSASWLK